MELNKNYIVAGASLVLIILLVLLMFSRVLFLLPWNIYLIINGIFPLIILGLLVIALVALMTGRSKSSSEKIVSTTVIIGLLVIIAGIFVPVLYFEAFIHNQGQGIIDYTVSVTGLKGISGNIPDDVIIPLPMQNDEPLFPVKKLEGQTFGEWRTSIVELPGSDEKMLAFQHIGINLTDIDAEFYDYLPNGLIVDKENKVYLSPVTGGQESLIMADRFAGSSNEPFDYDYRSQIYLPDEFKEELNQSPDEIRFNILLRVNTGKTGFMTKSVDYRFTIDESLSLNTSGIIPVNVSVHVS